MIPYFSNSKIKEDRDWRARLNFSRDLGTGFAAPGGEFTRALYEWSFTPDGSLLESLNGEKSSRAWSWYDAIWLRFSICMWSKEFCGY